MEFLQFDPAQDYRLLFLALALPVVGYLIQIFFGKKLPRQGDWLLISGMFVTMCITVLMFAKSMYAAYNGIEFSHHSGDEAGMWFHWLYSSAEAAGGTPNVSAAIFYDPLGAAMLMAVGVVSFCVHLFSSGYMQGDKRYSIFFAEPRDTRTFLLTLNNIIHAEVRKLYPDADVPTFTFDPIPGVEDPSGDALVLGYRSGRMLCGLAEGFIEGAAAHYSQAVRLDQPRCMLRGDEACAIVCSFEPAAPGAGRTADAA